MAYQFDFSSIDAQTLNALGSGLAVSLKITITAILFGIVMGTLLAIMRNARIKFIAVFATTYITIFRSLPLVIVLLWFFLVTPQLLQQFFMLPPSVDLRMASALVAFSMFEAAYFAEIVRSGIKSVPFGQTNAARALGLSTIDTWRYVILPQAFRNMLPLFVTQSVILFQDTSLVYVSALHDFFGTAATIGERDGRSVELLLFVGLAYFLICSSSSFAVRRLLGRKNA